MHIRMRLVTDWADPDRPYSSAVFENKLIGSLPNSSSTYERAAIYGHLTITTVTESISLGASDVMDWCLEPPM